MVTVRKQGTSGPVGKAFYRIFPIDIERDYGGTLQWVHQAVRDEVLV